MDAVTIVGKQWEEWSGRVAMEMPPEVQADAVFGRHGNWIVCISRITIIAGTNHCIPGSPIHHAANT